MNFTGTGDGRHARSATPSRSRLTGGAPGADFTSGGPNRAGALPTVHRATVWTLRKAAPGARSGRRTHHRPRRSYANAPSAAKAMIGRLPVGETGRVHHVHASINANTSLLTRLRPPRTFGLTRPLSKNAHDARQGFYTIRGSDGRAISAASVTRFFASGPRRTARRRSLHGARIIRRYSAGRAVRRRRIPKVGIGRNARSA